MKVYKVSLQPQSAPPLPPSTPLMIPTNIIATNVIRILITATKHTSIFRMITVLLPDPAMTTIYQALFCSNAIHIVQEYRSVSIFKIVCCTRIYSIREAKLTADDPSIINIPFVIANCTPFSV